MPQAQILLPASAKVEILADVHLHAGDQATFAAWQRTMLASRAEAIILLGDIFEVWVGDDWGLQDPFAQACAAVLHQVSRQRPVYFMHGNRDFLLGAAFAQSCGLQLLADPCVLQVGTERILLTHGDAWVTGDQAYQNFRQLARSSAWQADFLAQPLADRVALGAAMRAQSQAAQAGRTQYEDINFSLALAHLADAQASSLIHGHTHRPSCDALDAAHTRWVLSDWDAAHARGDYLCVQAAGISRHQVLF